ncbi:hypothetical protein LY78DRAFT_58805 [Colletotrichum sublineola]|nr:hypothetical protein LY78DRAFT_58805 [Colletotrichum sublineola]
MAFVLSSSPWVRWSVSLALPRLFRQSSACGPETRTHLYPGAVGCMLTVGLFRPGPAMYISAWPGLLVVSQVAQCMGTLGNKVRYYQPPSVFVSFAATEKEYAVRSCSPEPTRPQCCLPCGSQQIPLSHPYMARSPQYGGYYAQLGSQMGQAASQPANQGF